MQQENMQHIYFMTKALEWLEHIDINNQNIEYMKIVNEIKSYLYDNCAHHFIRDLIDITPDKSEEICYCEHCYTSQDAYLKNGNC